MTKVFDLDGNVLKEIKLPKIFSTRYRPDIIQRAVLSIWSKRRQPYGTNVLAGKRTSAHYHGLRRYRFTMMNREMARMARIHGKGSGYLAYRARFVPQAVKGRRAHPPKVEKIWLKKINKKENLLAIRSAIAATANIDLVKKRHRYDGEVPIVIEDSIEDLKKTKDVKNILEKIVKDDLERCKIKKVRAGKGKLRGRRYRKKIGPLIIVSKDCNLMKAARNLAGVDVIKYDMLDAELLAPGAQAGRLTIFTESVLNKLDEKFGA